MGTYNVGNGTYWMLVMHWDGNQWTQVPSPNPYPGQQNINYLLRVGAASSSDVWAVGYTNISGGPWLSLVEHWDGAQWSIVPSPNPGMTQNYLRSVSAISPNDVWAAGYYVANIGGYGVSRTLVEHWNGVEWSVVSSPNVNSSNNEIWDVEALSANDVWVVGYYSGGGPTFSLVEHWNGVQWNIVPSPNPPAATGVVLYGVSAISSVDIWAVGGWSNTTEASTVAEHWDGMQWSIIPSPNSDTGENHFYDVMAISSMDVWAVGYFCCGADGLTTLVEHWDGVQWSIVPSPNPSTDNNYLRGVAAISSNEVWAIGYYGGAGWYTLTEHYSSPCSTPYPTVTPSSTRTKTPIPTSTVTSTPSPSITPTATITPTPTLTPVQQIVGHVQWQSIPQPNQRNMGLTATLSLCTGVLPTNYQVSTDASGYFTLNTSLPNGTYNWHLKGSRWLASNGTLTLSGGTTSVEMGMQRAGDADGSNGVNTTDFTILKSGFGGSADRRADFDNDGAVTVADFTLLRSNFGSVGGAGDCP